MASGAWHPCSTATRVACNGPSQLSPSDPGSARSANGSGQVWSERRRQEGRWSVPHLRHRRAARLDLAKTARANCRLGEPLRRSSSGGADLEESLLVSTSSGRSWETSSPRTASWETTASPHPRWMEILKAKQASFLRFSSVDNKTLLLLLPPFAPERGKSGERKRIKGSKVQKATAAESEQIVGVGGGGGGGGQGGH